MKPLPCWVALPTGLSPLHVPALLVPPILTPLKPRTLVGYTNGATGLSLFQYSVAGPHNPRNGADAYRRPSHASGGLTLFNSSWVQDPLPSVLHNAQAFAIPCKPPSLALFFLTPTPPLQPFLEPFPLDRPLRPMPYVGSGMYEKRGDIRLFKSWTLVRLRGTEG